MELGVIWDALMVFPIGFICLVTLIIGISVGSCCTWMFTSGYTVGRAVEESILRDLLACPAHERSDRVLDLCFYPLADKSFPRYLEPFLTDEVIDHLEARINDPAPIRRRNPQPLFRTDELFESAYEFFDTDYSTPSIAQPMDYEKGVLAVIHQIQKYKMKRKNQDAKVHSSGKIFGNTFGYNDKLRAPNNEGTRKLPLSLDGSYQSTPLLGPVHSQLLSLTSSSSTTDPQMYKTEWRYLPRVDEVRSSVFDWSYRIIFGSEAAGL
ncbi:hypothetical protein CJF32_00006920 [Rutstroemia sp. NJR-2017a WRK4]|nr:hypothetical protein CJF32_00006920 [Rutstroemia sp. NJR-2017a WRK4]